MNELHDISTLPELKITKLSIYNNAKGILGCCNQHRNPANYYENAKTLDGRHIQIFPARPEICDESWSGHRHMNSVKIKWKYCPEYDLVEI